MQSLLNIIGLVSSIASLVLAIIAIWLSFKFFEKSNEASEKINEAAKGILSSVERLEKLFDKLYSDTFSVMKDTVSDMRKHLWSNNSDTDDLNKIEEEAEKKAETKIAQIKSEINKEINLILQRQRKDKQVTDNKIASLQSELQNVLEKAIAETVIVETIAKEETLREYIIKHLKMGKKRGVAIRAKDFLEWAQNDGLTPHKVFREIERMGEEKILELSEKKINGPDVQIDLL